MKKGGTAMTACPTMVSTRSSRPPAWEAANSPTGREITVMSKKAIPVSSAVTSSLPLSSWETGMA